MEEKQKYSVLIIDDDQDYLEILKRGLGNEFDILTVGDFQSLQKKLPAMRPSLIMLDKYLGNTNPGDVINLIRSYQFLKDTPIFLVSGSESGRKVALAYNLNGFLLKSTSFNEIRDMIRSGLPHS